VVFEKVGHLDNVGGFELAAAEVVEHVDLKGHIANHDDVVERRRSS
jgi:hypothetical protein